MTTSTRSQVVMAHIFCVAQQFTSVTVYVLGKKIMATVDVNHFVFMRLFFVIPIVLIAASLLTRKLSAWRLPLKTFGYIAASGIIGIFIAQTLIFVGLDKSTATNTSIISAPCTPLFTALFSVMRGTDKMNIPKGFGFLSSIIGALLLLQVWNFEFKGKTLGNALIIASTICNAFNSLIQKQILNDGHHPLVVQFYVCSFGFVSYMVGYAGFGLFEPGSWVIPGNVWIYIVIVGVVASAIPWCVSIIALKHTSPMTTSVYVVLQPAIAGVVGVVLLGEVLTWVQMLGSALVILGLVLVNAQPLVQRLFFRTKSEFELLPTAETKEIELEIITDSSEGDIKPSEEVEYELTQGETNAFVIQDGADYILDKAATDYTSDTDRPDYKPIEGIFTPEFVRHRHEHEAAEGYNFAVTLHKRAPPPVLVKRNDVADHNNEADYNNIKEPTTDFHLSSCKKDISEPSTLTMRPVV